MADSDTVKVRYAGRHQDGVDVRLPDGSEHRVMPGDVLEVPAGAFADGLLIQTDEWKPSGAAAKDAAAAAVEQLPATDAAQGG